MLSILTFILTSCSIYAQKIYNKEKTIFSLEENISYKKRVKILYLKDSYYFTYNNHKLINYNEEVYIFFI